jgi:hypothetical protein
MLSNVFFRRFAGLFICVILMTVLFTPAVFYPDNSEKIDDNSSPSSLTGFENVPGVENTPEYSYYPANDGNTYEYLIDDSYSRWVNHTRNLKTESYDSDDDPISVESSNSSVVSEVYDSDDEESDPSSVNVSSGVYDSDDDNCFIINREEDVGCHLTDPLNIPRSSNDLRMGFDSCDNISLSSNIVYNDFSTLRFMGDYKVFDGNGKTITLGDFTTMFYVGENQVLIIKNCRFIGAYTAAGHLLYCDHGIVYFENCSFEDFASKGYGCVVYSDGGSVSFKNCSFLNNSAHGGVIYNSGLLYIENCVFNGNKADIGGGVYSVDGVVAIIGSIFDGNSANIRGGGVASRNGLLFIGELPAEYNRMFSWANSLSNTGEVFKINTRNSFFRNNGGSVVSVDGERYSVLLKNVFFTNNNSECFRTDGDDYSFIIDRCCFEGNNGGALNINGSDVQGYVFSSSFLKNSGGAVLLNLVRSFIVFIYCSFAGNSGGAIHATGEDYTVFIRNCLFIGNHAFKGSSIFADGVNYFFDVAGSVFKDNFDLLFDHVCLGIFATLKNGVFYLDGVNIVNTVLNGAYLEWIAGALSIPTQIVLCVVLGIVILILIVVAIVLFALSFVTFGATAAPAAGVAVFLGILAGIISIGTFVVTAVCFLVIAGILIGLAYAAKAFAEKASLIIGKFLAYAVLLADIVLLVCSMIIAIFSLAGVIISAVQTLLTKLMLMEIISTSIEIFMSVVGILCSVGTVVNCIYTFVNACINPDILFDTVIAFAVFTFLTKALEIICFLSVKVPLIKSFRFFDRIAKRAINGAWTLTSLKFVIYMAQLCIVVISMGLFMGIEELMSYLSPEFEEWSSKYWYFVIMANISAATSTVFGSSLFFSESREFSGFMIDNIIKGYIEPSNGVVAGFKSALLIIASFIAKVLEICFQILHLDDIVTGVVGSLT